MLSNESIYQFIRSEFIFKSTFYSKPIKHMFIYIKSQVTVSSFIHYVRRFYKADSTTIHASETFFMIIQYQHWLFTNITKYYILDYLSLHTLWTISILIIWSSLSFRSFICKNTEEKIARSLTRIKIGRSSTLSRLLPLKSNFHAFSNQKFVPQSPQRPRKRKANWSNA